MPSVTFNHWDLLLLIVASIQGTAVAYLRSPRLKAIVMSLPFPFTCVTLALGQPVSAGNLWGLGFLYLYFLAVYLMYVRWRLPIVWAIIIATATYLGAGLFFGPLVPRSETAFWLSVLAVLVLGVLLLRAMQPRHEDQKRTPLPVAVKLPIIAGIVGLLILVKHGLLGFAPLFPMVSIITAYEARHCLWTMCRQIPILMLTMSIMISTIYVAQRHLDLRLALLIGWAVFLPLLWLLKQRPLPNHLTMPAKPVLP
jgi:hypothetical protein